MKIILSRKGVDSGAGGMASPILPCGCLCSIPIPTDRREASYSNLWVTPLNIGAILKELRPHFSKQFTHLDPDLRRDALRERPMNWRPAFGQCGPASTVLKGQKVGEGDL